MLHSQYQEQLQEQQARHDEQLHSLVDTDLFDSEEKQEEDGDEIPTAIEEDTAGSEVQQEAEEMLPSEEEAAPVVDVSESSPDMAREVDVLKAELQDVKNRSTKLVTSLRAQLAESHNQHANQMKGKEEEIAALTMSLSELQKEQHVLKQQVEELEQQKDQQCEEYTARIQELALQQKLQEDPHPSLQVPEVKELADHSTQWSQSNSPFSVRSPHLVTQEVTHSPRSSLQASSLLASSATDSVVLSVASAPTSSPPQPIGSAVSIGGTSDHLHFLGMGPSCISKLSFAHEQEPLTADHPLVAEWNKTYELFRKFREGLVEKLVAVGGETAVEELTNLDPFDLDISKDLTGQITQMRFTLTLALHQLETSLQEYLTAPDVASSVEESGKGETDHLKLQVTKLQQLLKQAEERHCSELQGSKDTITNLSLKVESLKAELANLRQCVAQGTEDSSGVAFFTQLDVDRNEKALQQAVASHQLTDEEYSCISHNMAEYLSISHKRLAHITHQLTFSSQTRHAIHDVEQSLHPKHTAHVIGMIKHLQKKRQEEFEAKMEELSSRRQQLSATLQSSLTSVENEVGLFLIKPIYPIKPRLPQSLIVPLNRSPPQRPPSSRRPTTTGDVASHTAVGVVTKPRDTTAHSRNTSTPIMGGDKAQSGRETAGTTWSVASSRAQSASIQCSPVLPRLVELETRRMREPMKLLSHLAKRNVSSVHPVEKQEYPTLPSIRVPHNP